MSFNDQPSPYPNQGGYGNYGPDPSVSAPTAPPAPAGQLASWGQRASGYMLDVFVPSLIIGFVVGFFAAIIGMSASASLFLVYLVLLVFIGWNRWFLGGTTGQSLGRKQVGITLISEKTGQPIGPGMAFVRDLCHLLDSLACYVGWLFPLWDVKRQTFADKIMKTVVIDVR